jgi:hypothetical protein
MLFSVGAFVLGWILSAISSRMSDRKQSPTSNTNDHRIRSLEADQRVAQSASEKAKETRGKLEGDLKDATTSLDQRDVVIAHQQKQIDKLKRDVKVSVRKTRELRAELTDRASENIRSEVKLREVETELEVAHVSADMIATGVLDYSLTEEFVEGDKEEGDESDNSSGDDSNLGKAVKDF